MHIRTPRGVGFYRLPPRSTRGGGVELNESHPRRRLLRLANPNIRSTSDIRFLLLGQACLEVIVVVSDHVGERRKSSVVLKATLVDFRALLWMAARSCSISPSPLWREMDEGGTARITRLPARCPRGCGACHRRNR